MDLTRLLMAVGIFAVAFPLLYWRLKRDESQGINPEESLEQMNRWTVRGSSTAGIVIAAVLVVAGIAEANLVIIAGALALIAFQIWRRSTVS
ncbi:MAG TPA: hypothetical protein VI039_11215 [Solirubrobacterales bacterium]